MGKFLTVSMLAFGILVGCQASPASTPRDASPKWEYKLTIISFDGTDSGKDGTTKELNKLGADGWEYVNYIAPYTLFRRPRQ